jgi:hypothetical protein
VSPWRAAYPCGDALCRDSPHARRNLLHGSMPPGAGPMPMISGGTHGGPSSPLVGPTHATRAAPCRSRHVTRSWRIPLAVVVRELRAGMRRDCASATSIGLKTATVDALTMKAGRTTLEMQRTSRSCACMRIRRALITNIAAIFTVDPSSRQRPAERGCSRWIASNAHWAGKRVRRCCIVHGV